MNSLAKQIFQNSLLLVSVRVLSKAATIVVMAFAARSLGVESFGVLGTILALTTFSGLIADFGLVLPSIRSISLRNVDEKSIVHQAFSARLFWSVLSLSATMIASVFLGYPHLLVALLAVCAILDASSTALIRSFEGKLEIRVVTAYTVLERFVFCILVVTALWIFQSLLAASVAYLVSYTGTFLLACFLFRRRFGPERIHFSLGYLKEYTRIGLPFFLTTLFSVVYYRTDIILLDTFRSHSEVGVYNAAMRVIDAQMFIPMTLMASIYPVLSRLYLLDGVSFGKVFWRSLAGFALLGLVFASGVFFASDFIIEILYGVTYDKAAPLLALLSIMLMFYFPNFLLSQTLIAMNMETSFTLVMFGAAVLSLCGNSLFIPSHGAQAAVWARLSIELLMTLSFLTILYLHARRQEVTSGLWARSFAIKTPQR